MQLGRLNLSDSFMVKLYTIYLQIVDCLCRGDNGELTYSSKYNRSHKSFEYDDELILQLINTISSFMRSFR